MEPECLVPHKNKRVCTPLPGLVRQPIYTGSVGYADRYLNSEPTGPDRIEPPNFLPNGVWATRTG